MEPLNSSFCTDRKSLISNLSKIVTDNKGHKVTSTEPTLLVLQTATKYYAIAVDYRAYRLSNQPSRYDKKVFSYIAKRAQKIKSQTKARFFDPKLSISVSGNLETFQLACNTNHIHGG